MQVAPLTCAVTRPGGTAGRTLIRVRTQRGYVDYALKRRAVLAEVMRGQTGVSEVCDASPYLVRAAKFHGTPTDVLCPVCRKEELTNVFWIYGDEIKHLAGSARTPEELERLATRVGEFDVYQVEVCRTCSWNHLVASFVMGFHGDETAPPQGRRSARSRRTAVT